MRDESARVGRPARFLPSESRLSCKWPRLLGLLWTIRARIWGVGTVGCTRHWNTTAEDVNEHFGAIDESDFEGLVPNDIYEELDAVALAVTNTTATSTAVNR